MKKLFTNDKFFLATVLIAIFGVLFNDTVIWLSNPENAGTAAVVDVLSVLCTVVLYISYKKHSKNVMKCIMGALLMLVLLQPIFGLSGSEDMPGFAIVLVFQVIFSAALFISHNLVNSDHHSNAGYIRFNQLLCVCLCLCNIVCPVLFLPYDDTVVLKVADLIFALGSSAEVAAIVCVESRLDAYRLDREAAGWTEEKGYPENYVHEYEKK